MNLKGTMTVTKAVLEGMVPRKYGKIVNLSSDAGRHGSFGEAAYGAAKAGIIALTKAWARELMEYDITVNSVSPYATTPGMAVTLMGSNGEPNALQKRSRALLNCIERRAKGHLKKWLRLWLSLPRTKPAILPDRPSV